MIQSKLCDMLGIAWPIFQGGMAGPFRNNFSDHIKIHGKNPPVVNNEHLIPHCERRGICVLLNRILHGGCSRGIPRAFQKRSRDKKDSRL